MKQHPTYLRRPLSDAVGQALSDRAKGEWQGLILMGLHTGQRLRDIVRLSWKCVDLKRNARRFPVVKIQRTCAVPLSAVLRGYLVTVPKSSEPRGPVFPESTKRTLAERAEDRWRKPMPFGNRTDRGWNITSPRKRADFQQVVRDENAGRNLCRRKSQMSAEQSTCASSGPAQHWDQIDWDQCRHRVKRLQARIVKATKAGPARAGLCHGSSRMRRKVPVRFQGARVAARPSSYPTQYLAGFGFATVAPSEVFRKISQNFSPAGVTSPFVARAIPTDSTSVVPVSGR